MADAFYPFVGEGSQDNKDLPDLVKAPARIAVFDDPLSSPRVVVVQPTDVRSYLEEVTATVTRLAKEQGGAVPFTVIREVVENFVHAYFSEPTITILDGGNTIRFSDQGPGIKQKDKALEYGMTSATVDMKRYIRGVGSGLPYVQQYVTDHGGTLTIEDNIGGGALVTISMPNPNGGGAAMGGGASANGERIGGTAMPGSGDAAIPFPGGLGAPVDPTCAEEPGEMHNAMIEAGMPAAGATVPEPWAQSAIAPSEPAPRVEPCAAPAAGLPQQAAPQTLPQQAASAQVAPQQAYPAQPGYPQPYGYPSAAQPQSPYPPQMGYGMGGYPQTGYAQQPGYPAQPGYQATQPTSGWGGYPAPIYQQQGSYPVPGYPRQPGMTPLGQPFGAGAPVAGAGAQQPTMTWQGSVPLTDRGRAIVLYLVQHESVGPTELSQLYGSSMSTWTRELKSLETQGILHQAGQKRFLTDVGRAIASQLQ